MRLPQGFEVLASTDTCPYAAVRDTRRNYYAVQFHPESIATAGGRRILENFLRLG